MRINIEVSSDEYTTLQYALELAEESIRCSIEDEYDEESRGMWEEQYNELQSVWNKINDFGSY